MDNELKKAYSEVYKIINLMDREYIEKIPEKIRKLFKEQKDENYVPQIDVNIPLLKQNLQSRTLSILAMINLDYWCESEEERNELLKIYDENDKIKENKARIQYNPNELFQKCENKNEKMKIIEYKEKNLFSKIIEKIMKKFSKRNRN